MRKFPYVGTYAPPPSIPLAATCGNFVIMDAVTLLHTPGLADAIKATPLRLVVQIMIPQEFEHDPYYDWPQVSHIYAGLAEAGLLERVVAILVDEEYLTRAYARRQTTGAIHEALDVLARAIRRVRSVFGAVYIGHVETLWHESMSFGIAYYRPIPAGLDFLGLSAYVAGPVTREAFDRQVRPIYDHAGTLGKDILIVPQAFEDGTRSMPAAYQLQWWIDAAPTRTVGVAWFQLGPWPQPAQIHGFGRGLVDYPDRLAAVQYYARHCDLI